MRSPSQGETVIEGIERGLADAEAGRTVPHAKAMARLDAVIAAVERQRGR